MCAAIQAQLGGASCVYVQASALSGDGPAGAFARLAASAAGLLRGSGFGLPQRTWLASWGAGAIRTISEAFGGVRIPRTARTSPYLRYLRYVRYMRYIHITDLSVRCGAGP
jgi:hypothetical protein